MSHGPSPRLSTVAMDNPSHLPGNGRKTAAHLLGNMFSMGAMRIGTALISFVVTVVLARWMGPAGFGELAVLLSTYLFLQLLPSLGLHMLLIRELAMASESGERRLQAQSELVSNALVVSLLGVIPCGVGVWLAAPWVLKGLPDSQPAVLGLALTLIPMAFTSVADATFMGIERMRTSAWVTLAESLLRSALILLVVSQGGRSAAIVACLLLSRCAMVLMFLSDRELRQMLCLSQVSMGVCRRLLSHTPVLFTTVLASVFLSRLDMLSLPAFAARGWLSQTDIGQYGVGIRLYEFGLMVPTILSVVMFPVFSRLGAGSGRLAPAVALSLRAVLLLGLPAVALAVAATPLITLIFGAVYGGTTQLLPWLLLALLAAALGQLLSVAAYASGRQDTDLMSVVSSCGCLAVALVWLVPVHGVTGAAMAVCAMQAFSVVLRTVLLRQHLPMTELIQLGTRALTLVLLGVTTAICLGMVLDAHQRPLAWLAGSLVYLVALTQSRQLTRQHLNELLGLLARRKD